MKKYRNNECIYDDMVIISCKKLDSGDMVIFKDETMTNIYRRSAK